MGRRVEGTTLGGFGCDYLGCPENGAWAACACIPFKGFTEKAMPPFHFLFDTQVCLEHRKDVRIDKLLQPRVVEAIKEMAFIRGGEAAMDRIRLQFMPSNSGKYLEFQQNCGLVPKDDAMIKAPLIIQ